MVREKIERALDMFDTSFIHRDEELILHKKWNVYILLSNIESPEHFDYKILSYLSYYTASNHYKKSSKEAQWAMGRLNRWFRQEFNYDDLQEIYCRIGCGANQETGIKFIQSGFDMKVLERV